MGEKRAEKRLKDRGKIGDGVRTCLQDFTRWRSRTGGAELEEPDWRSQKKSLARNGIIDAIHSAQSSFIIFPKFTKANKVELTYSRSSCSQPSSLHEPLTAVRTG